MEQARDELVRAIAGLDAAKLRLSDEELGREPEAAQFLVGAGRHLPAIRRLEFAVVISHDHNDPPSWRQWREKARREALIARFKNKPVVDADQSKQDGLAFLCVQNMLLTGFDAPLVTRPKP